MSNFTFGILMLNQNRDIFKRCIEKNNLEWDLNRINERWSVLETDDQFVIEKSTFNMIVGFSKEMPFLYFLDAEDHEWGFTIFDHGCEIVSFNVQHGEIIDSDVNIGDISKEFMVFNMSKETINQISKILFNANNTFENTWQQVEEFKKAIGIEEFY